MEKIGILGGTFDPIHNGHITLAKESQNQAGLAKVIFVPARVQPFKMDKTVTEPEHRLAMLKLAIDNIDGFEISDCELSSPDISYTFQTLRVMKKLYPEAELYFITGTDALLKIKLWKNAEEILTQYNFIVGNRPGYKEEALSLCIAELQRVYNTNIIKIDGQLPQISSTEVRAELKKGFIPEAVERYIKEHEFYKGVY